MAIFSFLKRNKEKPIDNTLGQIYVKPSENKVVYGPGVSVPGSTSQTTSGTTVYNPGGANISTVTDPTSPTPSPNRSGGGGSSSSGISTPTNQPTQNLGGDTPSSYSGGTVTKYEPPKLSSIPSYVRTNIKDDPFRTIGGAANIAYGATIGKVFDKGKLTLEEQRQKEFQAKIDAYNSVSRLSSANRQAALQGYQGTATNMDISIIPEKVLIRDASLGDQAALEALAIRDSTEIQNKATEIELNKSEQDKKSLDKTTSALQEQVNAGLISVDKANEALQKYAEELDTKRQGEIQKEVQPLIDSKQKVLDKIAKKGKITRIAVSSLVAVGLGAASVPLVAALPKIVQGGIAVVGGGAAAYTTGKTVYKTAAGEMSVLSAAEVIVPAAAFMVGAGIGSRFGRGITKTPSQLDTILQSPEVKLKSTNLLSLTSEAQIKSYKFSPEQEARLINQINMGQKVYIRDWKLYSDNPKIQEILNKELPNTKITSFGDSQSVNNVNIGNSLTRVEISKGKYQYIDVTGSRIQSVSTPEGTVSKVQSIKTQLEPQIKNPTLEFSKSLELSPKPQTKLIFQDGQLKRVVQSESFKFEGSKAQKQGNQPITFKDLQAAVESEVYKKYPSSKSTSREIQDLTGINFEVITKDVGKSKAVVQGVQLDFATKQGASKVEQIPKPIDFNVNKKSKSFDFPNQEPFDLTKEINKIVNKKGKSSGGQTQVSKVEQIKVPEFKMQSVEPINEASIKRSIQRGTRQANEFMERQQLKQEQLLKKQRLTQDRLNAFGLSEGVLNLNSLNQKLDISSAQALAKLTGIKYSDLIKQSNLQTQKLSTSQITPQNINYDFNFRIPSANINKIPVIPPTLPNFNLGGGKTSSGKKSKRKEVNPLAKYTASLGAAEFQKKGIKITRKQLEELNKKTYTGFETRGLVEVVPDKDLNKIKSELKKVNF